MDTDRIRSFRRHLRHFTSLTNTQLRRCCGEVTLARCLVLLEVEEQERLTVGQLATRLRLDDSTLSRTIDGLVRIGFLERLRDDEDRRVVWVRLTREGAAACDEIHRNNDAIYRNIFAKIPPSERDTAFRGFEILVRAFLDYEDDPGAVAEERDACAILDQETSS